MSRPTRDLALLRACLGSGEEEIASLIAKISGHGASSPQRVRTTARRLNGLIKPTEAQEVTRGSSDRVDSSGSHSIKSSRKQGSRDGKR